MNVYHKVMKIVDKKYADNKCVQVLAGVVKTNELMLRTWIDSPMASTNSHQVYVNGLNGEDGFSPFMYSSTMASERDNLARKLAAFDAHRCSFEALVCVLSALGEKIDY